MITFNDWSFSIDSTYLWGILAIAIIIFFVMGYIYNYHWKFYGVEGNSKVFAKSLFWIVSFVVIILATISLLVFEQGF